MFFQTWCLGVEMTYGIETPFRVEMRGACFGFFFPASFFLQKKNEEKDILISRTQKRMYCKNDPLVPPKHNRLVSCALPCYCGCFSDLIV